MNFNQSIRIKTNKLLRGFAHTLSLENALDIKNALDSGTKIDKIDIQATKNLLSVTKETLLNIYNLYGERGLYKLFFMASTNSLQDFLHSLKAIDGFITFEKIQEKINSEHPAIEVGYEETELVTDNQHLIPCRNINDFNWNVIQPDLSWSLYLSGVRHGFIVYGMAEPRILISHPYQGINETGYDVYNNSLDVVTSLHARGYRGSFLFLDCLDGLNYSAYGTPAWALWFSILSIHSDLVLFLKGHNNEFSSSQQLEIELTPTTVQKKIVEMPIEELQWATAPKGNSNKSAFVDDNENITEAYNREIQASYATPFIQKYNRTTFPEDKFIRIDATGKIDEYPLTHSIYQYNTP